MLTNTFTSFPMQCNSCQNWQRLLVEGSVGGPQKLARAGWGNCNLLNTNLVRIKGFLETQEKFYCACFSLREQPDAQSNKKPPFQFPDKEA